MLHFKQYSLLGEYNNNNDVRHDLILLGVTAVLQGLTRRLTPRPETEGQQLQSCSSLDSSQRFCYDCYKLTILFLIS